MASSYKTPGVYIEEVSKFPPSVAQVETAIPAFIGYTQKAMEIKENDLLRKPVRISSMAEYFALFGDAPKQAISVHVDGAGKITHASVGSPSNFKMYHALRMFFANGGGPCYIISVGGYTTAGTVDLPRLDDTTGATPGGLAIAKQVDEITLFNFPDAPALGVPSFYSLYSKVLSQCADLQDRFAIIDCKMDGTAAATAAAPHNPVSGLRNAIGTDNLKYGAAYYPWLKTTMGYNYDASSVTFSHPDDGASGTGDLNEVTWATAKADDDTDGTDLSLLITNQFEADIKKAISRLKVSMPPGALIAGVYASVDNARGVWKAPANVSLRDVVAPSVPITEKDQESMNIHSTGKSVNAIRAFTGKGILVWGARTLAGNDNEWRYVSVRRFFNMVEESVKKASEQFVFEPNDANTWVKVRAMIENYLTVLWRQGALAGAKAEDAFFVKIGLGETMTALDILEGRMIVEIGMAAVRPAEFIILRFSHKMQES